MGTFASRGAVVTGNATHAVAKQVRAKILRTAAEHSECAEADFSTQSEKRHPCAARLDDDHPLAPA